MTAKVRRYPSATLWLARGVRPDCGVGNAAASAAFGEALILLAHDLRGSQLGNLTLGKTEVREDRVGMLAEPRSMTPQLRLGPREPRRRTHRANLTGLRMLILGESFVRDKLRIVPDGVV